MDGAAHRRQFQISSIDVATLIDEEDRTISPSPLKEGSIQADLCVIGAGSGGLSVAAGAVQMGASVVLFERGAMGGDCLNYGCVPSKSLLAAAARAEEGRQAHRFGVTFAEPEIDFGAVHDHVHEVIASIAPHDSVERFEGLGVKVFQEEVRFTGPRELLGDKGTRVRAKRFVIATGSTPAIPPIAGLDKVAYLTNESLFDLTRLPERLVILGGGPIGVEMAQAFRRLGAEVAVLEMIKILPNDDPELAAVIRNRLIAEGVEIFEGAKAERVDTDQERITVHWQGKNGPRMTVGTHLLVAAGRRPNVENLDLGAAEVRFSPRGVEVNAKLRTSNRRIYAIGDVIGQFQFTHAAGYHAGIAIRNILFRMGAKTDDRHMPWVTYTDPELAQVGLNEAVAKESGVNFRILRAEFAENDRARAERATQGLIKVITDRRGRILGAAIAGRHAGELLLPWSLAISKRLKIGAMAGVIAPYPSLSEISKRAAGSYYADSLFSGRTKRIVRVLMRLG